MSREVTDSTDIRLSCDWAPDVSDPNNHRHVSILNRQLKELGYQTWFDEEQIMDAFDELISRD